VFVVLCVLMNTVEPSFCVCVGTTSYSVKPGKHLVRTYKKRVKLQKNKQVGNIKFGVYSNRWLAGNL